MRSMLLAGAAVALVLGPTAAAAASGEPSLFISPCGEPFVAPAGRPYPIIDWFNKADANHDHKLDPAEFRADANRFFDVLDRNKDGVISSQEINVYEIYMVPEILAPNFGMLAPLRAQPGFILADMQIDGPGPIDPGGDNQPSDTPPRQRLNTDQGAVRFSLFKEPEPVRAADRNFDYLVTRAEFAAHADAHFKALDVNGDGFVTWDELPITPAERAMGVRKR